MPFYRDRASQTISVYAWDTTTGLAKTGDAGNITAQISKDSGTAAATGTANPTELDATDHPGVYDYPITLAESVADKINLTPVSATANIQLDPIVIYTTPTEFSEFWESVVTGSIDDASPAENDFDGDSGLSAVDDHYNGLFLHFTSGPNQGKSRMISDYVGSTQQNFQFSGATGELDDGFDTTPTNGDTFIILARGET
jgi:hypothetical protein